MEQLRVSKSISYRLEAGYLASLRQERNIYRTRRDLFYLSSFRSDISVALLKELSELIKEFRSINITPLAGLKALSRYALNAGRDARAPSQINNLRYRSMMFQFDRINQHVRSCFHDGLFPGRIFGDVRLRR